MLNMARVQRLGTQLGLLALVLIVLAPLFSQLRAGTDDWSWLAELACHDGVAQAPEPASESPQTFKLDACGYCSLLINSPALNSQDWGRFSLTSRHLVPQPLHRLWPALESRFPAAQSRAPPFTFA